MDQTQLQQKIAEAYTKLPPDVQEFFSNMKWMDTLQEISQAHDLSTSQKETLGTETTLLLLGVISKENYIDILFDELGVSDDLLERITAEINESIIEPISDSLNKAYEDNTKSLVEEKYGDTRKLDEKFNTLPKEVKDAIVESGYQLKLVNIATEKNLSIDQMQTLEEATNKVILNTIHPDKYEEELNSKLGVSPTVVSEIVNNVNEDILKNIREILRNNWEKSKGVAQEGEDEVPIPPYAVVAKPETPKTFASTIPKPIEETPKTESGIYKSAGIEMVSNEPEKEDVMKSIIGSKLSAPTVSKPVVSNQTIPKINHSTPEIVPPNNSQPVVAAEKPHDPYHEAI
jgi:hypothetical protein